MSSIANAPRELAGESLGYSAGCVSQSRWADSRVPLRLCGSHSVFRLYQPKFAYVEGRFRPIGEFQRIDRCRSAAFALQSFEHDAAFWVGQFTQRGQTCRCNGKRYERFRLISLLQPMDKVLSFKPFQMDRNSIGKTILPRFANQFARGIRDLDFARHRPLEPPQFKFAQT
jgi:hypothetical protein